MKSELYIGIMSGTSLDGADAVLADFDGEKLRVVTHAHAAFPAALRDELLELNASGPDEIHRSQLASQTLARGYASLVEHLLAKSSVPAKSVRAIGCHGQTVRHMPSESYTVQLNAPAVLVELTGICVIADFRVRDVAAGGQGAPLVPAFHAHAFHSSKRRRAILNLGGMANVTLLDPDSGIQGFDCGPANVLMDSWADRHLGRAYDVHGEWAASGRVCQPLLERMLLHPFFAQRPPKSCGREQFNAQWLSELLTPEIPAEDVQATLAELTAVSVSNALNSVRFQPEEVIVCGGGAFNSHLVRRLTLCIGCPVVGSQHLGIPPDQVEALAFAWLARRALASQTGNVPAITGARGPRVLGSIWPV